MKTIEQVIKGIEFRLSALSLQMTKLEELFETEPQAKLSINLNLNVTMSFLLC